MSRTVANSACARGRLHACTCYRKFRQHPRAAQKHLADAIKTPRKEGERPDLDKPADIAAILINLLENKLAKTVVSRVSSPILAFTRFNFSISRCTLYKKKRRYLKRWKKDKERRCVALLSFLVGKRNLVEFNRKKKKKRVMDKCGIIWFEICASISKCDLITSTLKRWTC